MAEQHKLEYRQIRKNVFPHNKTATSSDAFVLSSENPEYMHIQGNQGVNRGNKYKPGSGVQIPAIRKTLVPRLKLKIWPSQYSLGKIIAYDKDWGFDLSVPNGDYVKPV